MKPLLKWAGGKARLAAKIATEFPDPCTGTYYEPFIGSAAVFLHRRAAGQVEEAVLADINPKLVALHVAVRDQLDDVLEELSDMPRVEYRDAYYEVRQDFNDGPHEGPLHAARFLWLNRACFNGLYRENRSGRFNVPVGRYARVALPPEEAFREVSRLLQSADIRVADFRDVVALADNGDQVYCDPPYVPLSATANFVGYAKSAFGEAEQKALAFLGHRAGVKGATVVISNHDTPYVRKELYGDFRMKSTDVARAISQKGASRGRVAEVIAATGPRPRRRRG